MREWFTAVMVISDGAVYLAPRERVVYHDGRRTAVRFASAELLWLETPEITAFRTRPAPQRAD